MAYTKQNFENGQILTAEQLNHMEQGIAAPDWNDVTNKPFYTNNVEILPETVFELVDGNGQIECDFEFKEGATYNIAFNGINYQCVGVFIAAMGVAAVGNLSPLGIGDDTGEPFALATMQGALAVMVLDVSATVCTLSIGIESVVPLNEKFLPYSIAAASDTLYWDGSFYSKEIHNCAEGNYGAGRHLVKMSDIVLTEEELLNGISIKYKSSAAGGGTRIVPGPITYNDKGVFQDSHGNVVLVKQATTHWGVSITPGIYFSHTTEEINDGFNVGWDLSWTMSLTVPGCGKFTSYNVFPAELMTKHISALSVENIAFRSPSGKLFALSINDNGAAVITQLGVTG